MNFIQALIKVRRYGSPWFYTYCPNCKEKIDRIDGEHREVKFCHLCGQKIEFDNVCKMINDQSCLENIPKDNVFHHLTFKENE